MPSVLEDALSRASEPQCSRDFTRPRLVRVSLGGPKIWWILLFRRRGGAPGSIYIQVKLFFHIESYSRNVLSCILCRTVSFAGDLCPGLLALRWFFVPFSDLLVPAFLSVLFPAVISTSRLMASAPNRSRFLDLPAELRVEIYGHVFAESRPIDLLLRKGPNNALRATCKFIYAESVNSYENATTRRPSYRADLVDDLITKYEEAVSPHRSIVFWPPICRAATLLRSINDHCLHACAKDGCYMCDDKAHRQCFDCGRNVAVALWCYDNPDDTPALVRKGFGGKELTPLGQFIENCRPVAYRRIQNRVDQSKVDRWWQRELDMQRAIDYRCDLRRRVVDEFWSRSDARSADFTADSIFAREETDAGMVEYRRIVNMYGEEGFLDWEPEYERRVRERLSKAQPCGVQLPPQIPAKRDAEKIKALEHRFKVTTPVGRFNTRVRGGRVEGRKPPLHERRVQKRLEDAQARGIEMPSLVLVGGPGFP